MASVKSLLLRYNHTVFWKQQLFYTKNHYKSSTTNLQLAQMLSKLLWAHRKLVVSATIFASDTNVKMYFNYFCFQNKKLSRTKKKVLNLFKYILRTRKLNKKQHYFYKNKFVASNVRTAAFINNLYKSTLLWTGGQLNKKLYKQTSLFTRVSSRPSIQTSSITYAKKPRPLLVTHFTADRSQQIRPVIFTTKQEQLTQRIFEKDSKHATYLTCQTAHDPLINKSKKKKRRTLRISSKKCATSGLRKGAGSTGFHGANKFIPGLVSRPNINIKARTVNNPTQEFTTVSFLSTTPSKEKFKHLNQKQAQKKKLNIILAANKKKRQTPKRLILLTRLQQRYQYLLLGRTLTNIFSKSTAVVGKSIITLSAKQIICHYKAQILQSLPYHYVNRLFFINDLVSTIVTTTLLRTSKLLSFYLARLLERLPRHTWLFHIFNRIMSVFKFYCRAPISLKILIRGRVDKKLRKKSVCVLRTQIALSRLDSAVDYCLTHSYTSASILGVKVWVVSNSKAAKTKTFSQRYKTY